MRVFPCLALIAALLLAPLAGATESTEADERALIINEFRYLMSKRDFAAVEKLYTPFLSGKMRTGSGVWKLSVIEGDMTNQFFDSVKGPGYWDQKEALLTEWRKAFPKSTAAMIYAADMYNTRAWLARGDGMANTVPEAKWPEIRQMANKARKALEDMGEDGKRSPWWYSRMIYISLLAPEGSNGARNAIIMEGISRHPTYYPIYFNALFSMTPKWGGSYQQIDHFIEGAVKNPANKDGISLYARTYWYLDQVQTKGELFKLSRARWDMMKPAFDDLLKRYPSSWNMSAYAYFACQAEDYQQADSLLRRLGDRLQLAAWSDKHGAEGAFNICKANIEQIQDPAENARLDQQAQQDIKRQLEQVIKRSKQSKELEF